jgi:hypothetical protein
MLDLFRITDLTTREELIDRINDLEEEVSQLETQVREQRQEIADLALTSEQKDRLEEAAEMMAAAGRIHPTPAAKARWMEGR